MPTEPTDFDTVDTLDAAEYAELRQRLLTRRLPALSDGGATGRLIERRDPNLGGSSQVQYQ